MKEGNSKKPQADDKGLNTLLGSTKQTSHAIIADDEIITNLIALDQDDKLRQFSNTFTIEQKFLSAEGSTFAEVTFNKGLIFVDWD